MSTESISQRVFKSLLNEVLCLRRVFKQLLNTFQGCYVLGPKMTLNGNTP